MWVLLVPERWGRQALQRAAQLLAAAFLIWHALVYCATASSPELVGAPPGHDQLLNGTWNGMLSAPWDGKESWIG